MKSIARREIRAGDRIGRSRARDSHTRVCFAHAGVRRSARAGIYIASRMVFVAYSSDDDAHE